MGNIFSMAAPPLDTDSNAALNIAMYIISYLLIIGVVLGIGICICIYIDHRQLTRLSAAVSDEEQNLNAREKEREEKVEEAPPLPPQSHQNQTAQFISDLQSCTYINERLPLLNTEHGATAPLRVLDERSTLEHTNKPAIFPRRSTTNAKAHVCKYFTKYGMTEAV
ncbi:hypothetical protein HO133_004832 [Letharia lupina]|uniref:Uncharacterized protein n=1 Tax=Letharia lupina TaxID=560253 RepID=A0A8H6L017_9LECA|nr:uncharacterized protein HO133_004832 [Letharia lupina]KAF6230488.1 hypothetical protein HO133_004832 [Letharia lupina]